MAVVAVDAPQSRANRFSTQNRTKTIKMIQQKLNVAIVGLGFGKEFIPIYQHHPNTNMYAICQRSKDKLARGRRPI